MIRSELNNIIGYLIVIISIIFSSILLIISITEDPNDEIIIQSSKIENDIEILIDEYGFPKIYANNTQDKYFALAYYQASERFWQINYIRDLMLGELNKDQTEDLLLQDKIFKSLNLRELSKLIYTDLDTIQKKEIIAFANGLNEYLLHNNNALSIDFQSYDYTPKEWDISDVILLDLYYSLVFDINLSQLLQESKYSPNKVFNNLMKVDNASSNDLYLAKSGEDIFISASKITQIDFPSNFIFTSIIIDSTISSGFNYTGSRQYSSLLENDRFTDRSLSNSLWSIELISEKDNKDSIEYIVDSVKYDNIYKKFYKINLNGAFYYKIDQSDSLYRIKLDIEKFTSPGEYLSEIDSNSISLSNDILTDSSSRRLRLNKLTDGQNFDILDLHIINNDIHSTRNMEFLKLSLPIIDSFTFKINLREKRILEDLKLWDGLMIKDDSLSFIVSEFFRIYRSKTKQLDKNIIKNIEKSNYSALLNSFREAVNSKFKLNHYSINSTFYHNNMFDYIYTEDFNRSGDNSTLMYINKENDKIFSNAYRMDFKLGDSLLHLNIPMGQSGNLNSPNSKDQFRLWLNGGYIKFVHSQSRINNYSKRILIERK